jgi:lipopolysaccharide transport system permease protein
MTEAVLAEHVVQREIKMDTRVIRADCERVAEGAVTGWSAIDWLWCLIQHRSLIAAFVRRDLEIRYRGSVMGFAWMIMSPVILAAIYTYVMGYIFGMRFPGANGIFDSGLSIYLAVILFQIVAEVFNRAPDLLHDQSVFVKKAIVPLRIIPVFPVFTAFASGALSLGVFLVIRILTGHMDVAIVAVPLVVLPFACAVLGMSWLLSSVGAFVRDVKHLVGFLVTFVLFSSPIFYPASMIPEKVRFVMFLNPLASAVVFMRDLLIEKVIPDPISVVVYILVCLFICVAGFATYRRLQPEFADVV